MRRTGEHGFSSLEIFIALLVLSVGALGLSAVQLTSLASKAPFSFSNARTATELAQEGIDRLFLVPWGELRSSHPDGFQAGTDGLSPAFSRLAASAGDSVTLHGTTFYRVPVDAFPDPPERARDVRRFPPRPHGGSAVRRHRPAVARNMERAGANAAIARIPVASADGFFYVRRIPVGPNVTGR